MILARFVSEKSLWGTGPGDDVKPTEFSKRKLSILTEEEKEDRWKIHFCQSFVLHCVGITSGTIETLNMNDNIGLISVNLVGYGCPLGAGLYCKQLRTMGRMGEKMRHSRTNFK